MGAPGLSSVIMFTAAERMAYRAARAASQKFDPRHPYLRQRHLFKLLVELNRASSGWTIDEHGCLSRSYANPH